MSIHAAVGKSHATETNTAAGEAVASALAQLPDGKADLCMVFATVDHDQAAMLQTIREAAGEAVVTGCSAEGVITQGASSEVPHAIAVMALQGKNLTVTPFLLEGYDEHASHLGEELAQLVKDQAGDAKCMFMFPDGLVGNCQALLNNLAANLDAPLPVVGGTAADMMTMEKTYQYNGTSVVSKGVSGVIIGGDVDVRTGVSHGCTPLGLQRTVTSASEGWVHTIDDEPAWEVFKEYLDGDPQDLNAEGIVHLCVGELCESENDDLDEGEVGDDLYVIHTPMALNGETGALFFPGGGLKEGATIRLTRRDPGLIRDSAVTCAQGVVQSEAQQRKPDCMFQFDCAGRGRILYGTDATNHIVTPLQEAVGTDVPWLGFHCYGELAPLGGQPQYHNYTVSLCALYGRND